MEKNFEKVTSPEMLLNNVSIQKMKEGYSKPRNPAIARAFAYMKIIKKWGTGIPRVFRECKDYDLPEPDLIDLEGDFRVNMYRKRDETFDINIKTTQTTQASQQDVIKLSGDDMAILKLVHDKPTMTQKEYALELGWTVDRVKYYI